MAHLHEKIDFTVEVFVVHKNKVLLRKHEKYDIWIGVGGHVELDEDPNESAIREVKEEIGLDVVLVDTLRPFEKDTDTYHELIPPRFLNRHTISDTHEHITLTYFATSDIDEVVPESPDDEWCWLTQEEIESGKLELMDHIQYYAMHALQEVTEQT